MLAFAIGIGVAVASALAPAREASLVPPTEAMARGRREYTVRVERSRDALIGLLLGVFGAIAAFLPAVSDKPLFGYLSALLLIAASALSIPALVYWLTTIASTLMGKFLGVETMLASRSLAGSLRRTSV
jgi:hypothetical protein